MHASDPSRRSVLACTAASAVSAALVGLPALQGRARAAAPTVGAAPDATPYDWRNVFIGGTGFVTGVVFHPAVKGLAYARTDMGGAYRWDDSAARWVPLLDWVSQDDSNLIGVESLAIDPARPNSVYLALGTYTQPWAGNGAFLRSDDRGATWTRTDLKVKLGSNEDGRGTGERLLVDPRSSDTLWLGTRHDGLLKSTDRGATWAAAPGFPPKPSASGQGVTVLVSAGRTLYAGWGDGDGSTGTNTLYATTDGTTWAPVPGQPTGPTAKMPMRAAYDARSNELYVTYADAPGPNGQSNGSVRKLATTTGTWTDVTPVKPSGSDGFGYGGAAVDAQRAGTVVVTTNNRWSSGDTLFRTTDGGRTWTSLKDSATIDVSETPFLKWGKDAATFGWWIQMAAIDPFDSQHIVYGTGATLFGTRDLKKWAPQIRGLEETAVLFLISPPAGQAHLLSGSRDIGTLYHNQLTVSPAGGLATNPVFNTATGLAQAAKKPSYVVRTGIGDNGNGAFSNDGGQTWAPFKAQPAIAKEASGPVAVTADGSVLVWSFIAGDGSKHPAQRSTDNGTTWSETATFPIGATPVADPADTSVLYAFDTGAGTLFASTDKGLTFTARATGLPSGDSGFQLVAAPGRSGDLWLSAKGNGLFRSTDGGRSFARVTSCQASFTLGFGAAASGAPYLSVYQVATVGGVTGVYRSDDAGKTWRRINDDQHQWGWLGQAITGDPRIPGMVYLATNGRGIQFGQSA
ncbi:1,4-beta-glucanase [Streptomyces sp. WI04-05B]|uniref:1,4-beta-glucanase n=1 Tax=Streptomyces TaxID=1883 RepID=UPI0029A06C0F|nr:MULTISPECIES: 1,4-beta-glucanase [unclassified Streptomyces]MDX2545219.1 1,4-beta-glucanase [Streptomyces sp. WI04-05B]MDX2587333.1 1,4-beta-glucanase [Streptomyces sp. WI04-05A]MDX3750936.1 1,4-beta-glucanase [Streptomyces sp. AK08-02]